ncbi:MAG: PfkB family carbohydrate kinase [Phycisphaerae bacterium]|nr:PfkB family carbohydrate kinase [Phycisphaerae bacterium]
MSLIVTGTIGIDTVHTPTGNAERVLGGSCAYFAAAASQLAAVRVVGAVGGDWPAEHRAALSRFTNVDLAGLESRPKSSTFAWGGRYFDNMNRRETLFTHLGVLEEAPPTVPAAYRDSKYVFLANTHPAVQLDLLRQFPARTFAVADTMDLWINIAREDLTKLFREIDGVVVNDQEAMQLTERSNAISAARAILALGPSFVVVKKGEHGAVLVHRDGVAALPAYPADESHVIDPTGAGDSFAGGMMGWIAGHDATDFHTIQTGLAWGTVLASFTIECFSLDRLARLDRAQLDARMATFRVAARVA